VRGAEPGDSLVVEILDVRPIEWGVATLIPGFGQLIEHVQSPPRVEYTLTEKGEALLPIIGAMREFGHEWLGCEHHSHAPTAA